MQLKFKTSINITSFDAETWYFITLWIEFQWYGMILPLCVRESCFTSTKFVACTIARFDSNRLHHHQQLLSATISASCYRKLCNRSKLNRSLWVCWTKYAENCVPHSSCVTCCESGRHIWEKKHILYVDDRSGVYYFLSCFSYFS